MKTSLIAMMFMLMLVEAPVSKASAADACEVTIETMLPAPQGAASTPLSELTPMSRMSIANAHPPFEPSGRVLRVSNETVPFPSPGGSVREVDLGNPPLGRIELRHLAGRRPEWKELLSDGKPEPDPWRLCPPSLYTGFDRHLGDRIVTVSFHPPGPIQDEPPRTAATEDLGGPPVVAEDTCEMTMEIIVPVLEGPYHAEISRLSELSPLAQRALAKPQVSWEASGRFLLVNGAGGETVPFPPVGQVRDVDLHSPNSMGIELRHLAGQGPDWVMLGVDGKPTGSPPVQCPTKYYEGFTLPLEDRLVVVRIHPLGPIEEPPEPASKRSSE
jgi:hypothetical protein